MYKEYVCKQGSEDWHRCRNGLLLTGSNIGTALGHNPWKSRNAFLIDTFRNIPVIMNKAMEHGQKYEPVARKWYYEQFGLEVSESGILIPDWDLEIGGSVDGLVDVSPDGPGMIEIKCPQKMYSFLVTEKDPMGMPMYHFDQIQFYLRVTERNWCDYVVWTPDSVKVKRVLRNQKYWDFIMYPGIRKFIDDLKGLRNGLSESLFEIPAGGKFKSSKESPKFRDYFPEDI